jgi:hypothetical protein
MNTISLLQQDTIYWIQPLWKQLNWYTPDTLSTSVSSEIVSTVVDKGEMERVIAKLEDITTYSIGFSDVISVISIPLIIMLFAFAFPFIFYIINHINSKYESKELGNLFESHISYKLFWSLTYIRDYREIVKNYNKLIVNVLEILYL